MIGMTKVTFPTAGLSSQESRLLKKRFRSELEVVRGLLNKAEVLVVGEVVNGGAAPSKASKIPCRGKDGRFLPSEARSGKDRAGAKRRKTSHVVEGIEPRMSQDEREHLAGSLWSLSAELPEHIVDFMQRRCSCEAGLNGGEMEIDLYSTGDASLFQLKKLLEDFADERKQRLGAKAERPKNEAVGASGTMSPSLLRQHEDGELAEEQQKEEDMYVDICGDASPVALEKVGCSSPLVRKESDDDDSVSSSPAPAFLPAGTAAAATGRITDLIARAQEEKRSRCRELDRKRAREELLEMERTAMPSDSIRSRDMLLLGIDVVEYIVSSDDEKSQVRSMDGKLRLGSGRGSLVQQLGLFLKSEQEVIEELEDGEII